MTRPAAERDADECLRALRTGFRSAVLSRSGPLTARVLASQLNWRQPRTETALSALAAQGHARLNQRDGGWFPVER